MDEKGILPNDPDFPGILSNFATLKSPETFPSGKFTGRFLKFYGNPALRLAVAAIWVGTDFYEAGKCKTLVRPPVSLFASKDEGTVRLNHPSVYDGLPCMRIDFGDRFYETRLRAGEEAEKKKPPSYLTIVTFKKSKWISDVNVLTPM